MEHEFYECPYIGNVIIQLTLIFFRGVETTNQIGYVYRLYGMRVFMCASMLKGIVCSSLLIYSHHIFGRAGNYLVWGLELGSLRPEHQILEDSGGPIGPILLLPGLSSNRDRQFQWCELMFIHIHSQKKTCVPILLRHKIASNCHMDWAFHPALSGQVVLFLGWSLPLGAGTSKADWWFPSMVIKHHRQHLRKYIYYGQVWDGLGLSYEFVLLLSVRKYSVLY